MEIPVGAFLLEETIGGDGQKAILVLLIDATPENWETIGGGRTMKCRQP